MNFEAGILKKNTDKPNVTAYQKAYPSQSSRFHPRDASLVQYTQIYKRNPSPKQNQRQKPHDYLNGCREDLQQNSVSLYAKKSQ